MKAKNKEMYDAFDVELAKQGRSVYTRDGRKVKILTFEAKNETPIVALIPCCDGSEYLKEYPITGRSNSKCYDLVFLKDKTLVGYANLYKNGQVGQVFKTEKEALENGGKSTECITTIKIEY